MATVRMSHQLGRNLVKKATEKYKLSNPAPTETPELKTKIREALSRMPIIEDFNEFKRKPRVNNLIAQASDRSHMWSSVTNAVMCFKEGEVNVINIKRDGNSAFRLELDTPMSLPGGDSYSGWSCNMTDFMHDDAVDIERRIVAAESAYSEWRDKYREFETSIESVVNNVNTVKQLLDVWPAAEKLLDADTIQRLHTKVTRKVNAQAVLDKSNFDPDTANQVILTASLLGD